MRSIFIITLVVLPLVYTNEDTFITDDFINEINSAQSLWKAGNHFDHLSKEEIRGMLGVVKKPASRSYKVVHHEDTADDIPETFDSREEWKNCTSIAEIVDQSACGSCWAVSTASSMSDRICIFSQGKNQPRISAKHIMSCCVLCGDGCNGGEPIDAWDYWRTDGIVTGGLYDSKTGCQPYPFETCNHHNSSGSKRTPCQEEMFATPSCSASCDTEEKFQLTYGVDSYMVIGETDIQKEILKNGPLVADFDVYEDFITYQEGIYQFTKGKLLGGHAVRIIGWGVENKTKYWSIANSWNEDWGEKGLFRMIRGSNTRNCGLENECSAGIPQL